MERPSADPFIVEEFRKKRTRQIIASIPVIVAVLILVPMDEGSAEGIAGIPASVLVGFAFASIVGIVIFSLFNWRCPACHGYLGRRISPRFCSRCGEQLLD
jgi:hypothetical protein